MFTGLSKCVRLYLFSRQWRKLNKHNATFAETIFDPATVQVGAKTYGPLSILSWGAENERLKIGSFVSIGPGVEFLLGGNHRTDTFSSFPFKVKCFGEAREATSKGPITIHDDVWIGTNSMILSGVTIGQGAVIGAGSIVTKDIPAYRFAAGNPAKILKNRFTELVISKLMQFDYSLLSDDKIANLRDLLYLPINEKSMEIIDKILTETKVGF